MANPDSATLPDVVDPRLWFEMSGCPGPHYFVDANSHILGRVYAYCPDKRTVTRISKSDITACSDEASYFLRGFLAGSQPAPPLNDDGMLARRRRAGIRHVAAGSRNFPANRILEMGRTRVLPTV